MKPKNAHTHEVQASPQTSPALKPESSRSDSIPRAEGKAYTEMPVFGAPQTLAKRSNFNLILAGLLLLAGLGFGSKYLNKTTQNPPGVGIGVPHAAKALVFTEAELDLKTTAEIKAKLLQGQAPSLVVNSKAYPLNSAANRVIENSPQLVQKILSDEVRFYTINIFDSQDEDGDVVQIAVDNVVIGFVDMTNKGLKISIPLEKNKSKMITVKGIHDGGGGITFGAILQETSVVTGVFNVGETRDIPLGFK